jgi:predicted MFS family arabinose efflux permease
LPLYLSEGIGGLATAIRGVGSLALIGDILEGRSNRGRLLGLHRGLSSLAFGLAALIGGSIADRYGSGTTFLVASGTAALGLIASFAVREAPHEDVPVAQAPHSADMAEITTHRLLRVLPFLVVVLIWAFANSSAFTFWPVYMSERGFSQTMVTRLWGIAALGEFGAMVLAGYLCERWGSHRLVALGLVGMGLVFVGYTQAQSIAALIPIQLFRSFAFSSYSAAAMLYATRMGLRRQRGRMAGLHASASSLGGISGAVTGGGLSSRFGLGQMIAGVGAFIALLGLGSMAIIPDPAEGDEESAPTAARGARG